MSKERSATEKLAEKLKAYKFTDRQIELIELAIDASNLKLIRVGSEK